MKKQFLTLITILLLCSIIFMAVPVTRSQVQNVKVLNYTYYIDSIGYLVVVGEVQNQGPNTISAVSLTGTVTSSDGTQVDSGVHVWGRNLRPQQKAPFYMEFISQGSSGGAWNNDVSDVAINVYQAEATSNYQYPNLEVTNQQSYIGTNKVGDLADYGVYWVTGSIKNTGDQTAQEVTVIGTFYNSQGQVVGVGYSDETTMKPYSIEAQQSGTFKLGAFDLNQTIVPTDQKIVTYSLLIQVQGPLLEGTPPVAVATPSPPPLLSTTPTPTNSQGNGIENNSPGAQIPSTVYIIIVVAVVVVVVAGLLLLRKPQKPKSAISQNKHKPKNPKNRS
jgi:hypothetical protein